MQESVDDDNLNDDYLVHLRNFILDEVEADIVYLQNKTIGKNHIQWDPNYHYKAWYKGVDKIVFGSNVIPKTDPGEYTVEPNAAIIMRAGETIHLQPGTYIKAGAYAHLKIQYIPCLKNKSMVSMPNSNEETDNMYKDKTHPTWESTSANESAVVLYPNPAKDYFTVMSKQEIPITAIHRYYHWTVTRGGSSQTFYDTVDVVPNGTTILNVFY